jgi:hypothetical protein
MRVTDVLELLANGAPIEEIVADYPAWNVMMFSPQLPMRRSRQAMR